MEWKYIEDELDKIWKGQQCAEELEDQCIEFKSMINIKNDFKELKEICSKYAVCFTNSNGGTIIFGVEDRIKGPEAFTGCEKGINLQKLVSDVFKNTEPGIQIEPKYQNYNNVELLEVNIPNVDLKGSFYSLKNSIRIHRVGADCLPIYDSTKNINYISPLELDYSRSIVPEYSWSDLDHSILNDFREFIQRKNKNHDYLLLNDYDFTKALGLITEKKGEEVVTLAGVLFLGKTNDIENDIPNSEIILMEMDDNDNILTRYDYRESLIKMIFKAQDKFIKEYDKEFIVNTGLIDVDLHRMPIDVFREALLNAVTHRDYTINSSVFIKSFPTKIEFSNPGSFIMGITKDNILKHSPAWRNRLISEVFQKIGMVLRSGVGVDRIYHQLLYNGKEPPIYEQDGNQVKLIVQDHIDKEFAKYIHNEKFNYSQGKGEPLPLDEMIIIAYLRNRGQINRADTARIIQSNLEEASDVLHRMLRKNRLEDKGVGGGRHYILSSSLYCKLKDSVGYARNGEIEKIRQEERIIMFCKERGSIRSKEIQEMFNISRTQAYQILKKMTEKGILKLYGEKSGTKYQINETFIEKTKSDAKVYKEICKNMCKDANKSKLPDKIEEW